MRQDVQNRRNTRRVRSLTDDTGNALQSVGPGYPAELIGLKEVPSVGSIIWEAGQEMPEEAAEVTEEVTEEVGEERRKRKSLN